MDTDKVWVIKRLEKLKDNVKDKYSKEDGKHSHNGRIKLLDKLIHYIENG